MPARHHSRPTHIVIADDHALFRAGVKTILKDEADLEIVGEAGDGSNLCRLVEDKKADVLLLDLAMPHTDGHEVLRQLKTSRSSVNALVLSASDDRVDLSLALDLGAMRGDALLGAEPGLLPLRSLADYLEAQPEKSSAALRRLTNRYHERLSQPWLVLL